MQDDDPDTVSAYLEFMYSTSVSSSPFSTEKVENDENVMRLIRLYILGEKLQDDDFCNEVLRTLGTQCDEEESAGIPLVSLYARFSTVRAPSHQLASS